jgi:hypothetical protein
VGGVVVIASALLFFWYTRRRRTRSDKGTSFQAAQRDDAGAAHVNTPPITSSKRIASFRRTVLEQPRRSSLDTLPITSSKRIASFRRAVLGQARRSSLDLSHGPAQLGQSGSPIESKSGDSSHANDDAEAAVSRDARLLQLHSEIDRLRAEIPNVHLLQAQIDQLREANSVEEAPPTYFEGRRANGSQLNED